jgi:hypothetical protein
MYQDMHLPGFPISADHILPARDEVRRWNFIAFLCVNTVSGRHQVPEVIVLPEREGKHMVDVDLSPGFQRVKVNR